MSCALQGGVISKAFTREEDGTEPIRLAELPQSPHPNFVTRSGLDALESRLRARRLELEASRADGDGSSAMLAIATAERDIRFLEGRINRAILVDRQGQPTDTVAFGAQVVVVTEDDSRRTFRIVGEDEADPGQGLITLYSPLGVALIGAKLGSTVEWKRPQNTVDLEIVAVRYPCEE